MKSDSEEEYVMGAEIERTVQVRPRQRAPAPSKGRPRLLFLATTLKIDL